jgi:hypothetical protein
MTSSHRRIAVLPALLLAALVLLPAPPTAQAQPTTDPTPGRLVLVPDSSGSMAEPTGGGQTRIRAAKDALRQVIGSLPEEQAGEDVGAALRSDPGVDDDGLRLELFAAEDGSSCGGSGLTPLEIRVIEEPPVASIDGPMTQVGLTDEGESVGDTILPVHHLNGARSEPLSGARLAGRYTVTVFMDASPDAGGEDGSPLLLWLGPLAVLVIAVASVALVRSRRRRS